MTEPDDLDIDQVDQMADLFDRIRETLSELAAAGKKRYADGDFEGVAVVLDGLAEVAELYDGLAFKLVSRVKRVTGTQRAARLAATKEILNG